MKAKTRSGHDLLSGAHVWHGITDDMVINFRKRYTYLSFRQKDNHLLVSTTDGDVDIVFTGRVPDLSLDHFEKDQLVLKVRHDEDKRDS